LRLYSPIPEKVSKKQTGMLEKLYSGSSYPITAEP
jgi:hypothetical protein